MFTVRRSQPNWTAVWAFNWSTIQYHEQNTYWGDIQKKNPLRLVDLLPVCIEALVAANDLLRDFILVLRSICHLSIYVHDQSSSHVLPALFTDLLPFHCWIQIKQELVEEYEQVKSIIKTLESFKMDKPVDLPSSRPEDYMRDPAVWPPPTPAEHRYNWRLLCWSMSKCSSASTSLYRPVLYLRQVYQSKQTSYNWF